MEDKLMSNIWVTSDWHFCHSRPFIYEPRGFSNEYEMNDTIIKRHNELVQSNDDVYCLGDCMLNNNELGIRCIKQLKGRIHIIRGNHDTDPRMKLYKTCENVVEICEGKFLNYKNYHFYLSHYPCLCSNYDDDKPLKARTISLCGHSHTQDHWPDMNKGLIFHVEIDINKKKPWLLDDIITELKNYLNKNK